MARRVRRCTANLTASLALLETEIDRRHRQAESLVVAARAVGMDSSLTGPVAGARSFAAGMRDQGLTLRDRAGAENALSVALYGVTSVAVADPAVKNDWTVQRPVLDLQTTEQRLSGAARVYNDHAGAMNGLLRGLSTRPFARMFGAAPATLFEADAAQVASRVTDDVPPPMNEPAASTEGAAL
ncbi:LemA family protein [Rhodococcus gannanensis]|uniref:LemA family protein n=1 Tax=Rhodococcus gannanensis TaxID=1960308 RepID=A0ABW4P9X3_9NOCA